MKGLKKINLTDYKTLREVVFNTLRNAIISGDLKPGERLMEVSLAKKMGVSRTPIREAIRKLELEGFVNVLPRKGAQVSEISMKDIIDVLEIRAVLDGLATSLCAQNITDEEIKELSQVHSQFLQQVEKENFQGLVKKDVEFHEIIYKCSRNNKLIQMLSSLREQAQRYRVIYLKDYSDHKLLAKEHVNIFESIIKKDFDKAGLYAKTHIKNQEHAIIKAINSVKD